MPSDIQPRSDAAKAAALAEANRLAAQRLAEVQRERGGQR